MFCFLLALYFLLCYVKVQITNVAFNRYHLILTVGAFLFVCFVPVWGRGRDRDQCERSLRSGFDLIRYRWSLDGTHLHITTLFECNMQFILHTDGSLMWASTLTGYWLNLKSFEVIFKNRTLMFHTGWQHQSNFWDPYMQYYLDLHWFHCLMYFSPF